MPVFKVHYFIVKPTAVPVFSASTGDVLRLTRGPNAAADRQRQLVIRLYEQYLTLLFGASLPSGWTAQVNRLQPQPSPPHDPDFSGVTIHWREPIVYWVSDNTLLRPSDATDRRPSLLMIREFEQGRWQEFDAANITAARNFIQTTTGSDPGGRALAFGWAPLCAEIFSQTSMARIPWSDTSPGALGSQGWQRHQARLLANLTFHEIAHGKTEWVNRPSPSGSPWSSAISGSIHNHHARGLCCSPVGYNTMQTPEDQSLIRDHVLCPMPYYKLEEPAADQCYQDSHSLTLTPP